jgi:hypothetical protein
LSEHVHDQLTKTPRAARRPRKRPIRAHRTPRLGPNQTQHPHAARQARRYSRP